MHADRGAMERAGGTLPESTSPPPEGRCRRCQAPLPPRSRPARRWCSPACGYQAFLDRKVAAQVAARAAEIRTLLAHAEIKLAQARRLLGEPT